MIFVTVGHQMPFDRLVIAVDDWAGRRSRNDVFAQIGESTYVPKHMRWVKHLNPSRFEQMVSEAVLVVAHAGTGSIFVAIRAEKPILVMPRRADLRETRNDHQLATVDRLCSRLGVPVVADENDLIQALDRLEELGPPKPIGRYASTSLTDAIRGFVVAGLAPSEEV